MGLLGLGLAAEGAGVIGIEVISPVLVEGATDTDAGAGSEKVCQTWLKSYRGWCL